MSTTKAVIPERASGVLLPVFSLPSSLDQGDFGPGAIIWLDWLKRAKQTYWLLLPLNPVDSTGSPYASASSLALNPLFISPERLVEQKLLQPNELAPLRRRGLDRRTAARHRQALLRQAAVRWQDRATTPERAAYQRFCQSLPWLETYALFAALKRRFDDRPWWQWPSHYQTIPKALRHIDQRLREHMAFEMWQQWQAAKQWSVVFQAAHERGIKIIGDLPFTVRQDSADVWAHPRLFHIRGTKLTAVSGMPPDQFTKRGQRWGTPLYRWAAHRRQGWQWWSERMNVKLARVDLLRLDHFQGFIREWAIPARAKDARHGRWLISHGSELFAFLQRRVGHLPFIVEDMGLKLPASDELRRKYHLPTIRIFEFGWSGLPRNIHALHHVMTDMVYMTSNHDLPPVGAWWQQGAKPHERAHLRPHVQTSAATTAIQLVMNSPACLAVVTMADVLNLGAQARINRPGTRRGNWRWRLPPAALTATIADQLAARTRRAHRAPTSGRRRR